MSVASFDTQSFRVLISLEEEGVLFSSEDTKILIITFASQSFLNSVILNYSVVVNTVIFK